MPILRTFTKVETSVTSTKSKIAAYDVQTADILALLVKNTGSNPFTAFEIAGKITRYPLAAVGNVDGTEGKDEEYFTLKNDNFDQTDYTVINTYGNPVTLAAGSAILLYLNVSLLDYIRVYATSASGTTVQLHASTW